MNSRRLGVDERREQLISTAQRLFARRVPQDVSLEDVARAAGVSRPLVYRYFPGGKRQLYEAALRNSAAELGRCFLVPATGPLSQRLALALDRYLAFVVAHGEGFTALLRGGSVAETTRTTAIVDGVRREAAAQVLRHLGARAPGPRLRMAVRTWVTAVEAASLIWLDEAAQTAQTAQAPEGEDGERGPAEVERQPPAAELRDLLLEQLVAQLVVTAGHDRQTARVLRAAAAMEPPGGWLEQLAARALAALAPAGPEAIGSGPGTGAGS